MDFPLTVFFLKRLAYLLCLIALIFFIQRWVQPGETIWLMGPAFLLPFITSGTEFPKAFLVTIMTGFCAASGAYLAAILHFPVLIAGYLCILTVFVSYFRQVYPQYFFPMFMGLAWIVMSTGKPVSLAENNARFVIFILITVITALLQIIFVSFSSKNDLKINKSAVLRNLKKLNQVIFSCLLTQEYSDNIYLYERRLHEQKKQYFQSMQKLKYSLQRTKTQNPKFIINADALFNNMMDYAQLRKRVTDYTTLSVCSKELTDIFAAIQNLMDDVMRDNDKEKLSADMQTFKLKINNLEDNYYHVLQVASREPLVFLLFINSLRALAENIANLHHV